MILFLCELWPYLAGGLIGWLLSGWLARRLKHEKIVEKEVVKHVDNPEHLSLISKLEAENSKIPTLVSQLALFQSSKPKLKDVNSAKLLAQIKELQAENSQLASLKVKLKMLESDLSDSKVSSSEDNKLNLLTRIRELEAENIQIHDLKAKIDYLEAKQSQADSKTIEVDNPKLLARIRELEAKLQEYQRAQEKEKIVEVDNPLLLAEIRSLKNQLDAEKEMSTGSAKSSDNSALGIQSLASGFVGSSKSETSKRTDSSKRDAEYRKCIHDLESQVITLKQGQKIDLAAARAAGIAIKNENDLTAIEGIGPKISNLIKKNGVNTFHALAATKPLNIQKILNNAGSNYKMANPSTWPDQANLAANNRWSALKALQDVLVAGVYPDVESDQALPKAIDPKTVTRESLHVKTTNVNHKPKAKNHKFDAAKVAGFKIKRSSNGYDDFTVVEGIGPKINELIHNAGIHTYEELGNTLVEDVQKILNNAGPRYKLAKPGTWPAQSDLAAQNKWEELQKWQSELDGGKE